MRDQHRAKQDLINEVVALRKQVTDLREAMADRQRVEDALRQSEQQLRALIDGSPVGLCLLRCDGSVGAANRAFARGLGYQSVSELISVGNSLGVFAAREEQVRVLEQTTGEEMCSGNYLFRCQDGERQAFWVVGARCQSAEGVALVVLDELRATSPGDKRSE